MLEGGMVGGALVLDILGAPIATVLHTTLCVCGGGTSGSIPLLIFLNHLHLDDVAMTSRTTTHRAFPRKCQDRWAGTRC
jgi:hypothetical protein